MKLPGSIDPLFSSCGRLSHTWGGGGRRSMKNLPYPFLTSWEIKGNCYPLRSNSRAWPMVDFMHFLQKSIKPPSPHMQRTKFCLHIHVSSNLFGCVVAISFDNTREDWNLHGWSPEWLITCLFVPLSSENDLSFIHQLEPPVEFNTMCLCTCVTAHVVSVWAEGKCWLLEIPT